MTALLLFLGILFLFFLILVQSRKVAVLLLPLLLFTYKLKVTFFGIPFNMLEIITELTFLAWFLEFFFCKRSTLLEFIKKEMNVSSPLLLWGLFVLLSFLGVFGIPREMLFETGIASAPVETFETLKIALGIVKTWLIPSWMFLVLLRFYGGEGEKFLYSYVTGAVFVGALSLFWKYGLHLPDTIDDRLGGIFVSANYLVFYSTPALIFVLTQLYFSLKEHSFLEVFHSKKGKFLLFAVPLLLLVFLLAKSYASWIVLIVLFGVFIFSVLTRKQRVYSLFISIALLLLLIFSQLGTKKFDTFFETKEQSSTSTRLEVYQVSLYLLKEHPLFGIGVGQYEAMYKIHGTRILGKAPFEWVMLHPHNLYISLWLSSGIGGLGLFLLMVFYAFKEFLRRKQWVLMLPFGYLLLHGMVDTPFWKMDMIFLMLLFLSIPLIHQYVPRKYE